MFKLFTGSYRELEQAFLLDVEALKKTDPLGPLLVVSPSSRLLDHLQQQLSKQSNPSPGLRPPSPPGRGTKGEGIAGAYLSIHFLTFYALADRLLQDSGFPEPVVREEALFTEVIRDLLEGRSEMEFLNRDAFRKPNDGPLPRGLCGALAGTLRDLRDSGARVVDCLKVALEGHLGEGTQDAAPILELYARVYEVLQKRGLRTSADLLRRAGERAPRQTSGEARPGAAGHPWLRQQKTLFLYGFYDLTGVQLDFVLSLADHPDARVYFPYVSDHPGYAWAEKLLNDPAFQRKVGTRTVLCPKSKVQSRPSKEINSTDIGPWTLDPRLSVEVWNCSGAHDEVWLAAKKILRLASSGIPYSQIALTARSLAPYLASIRQVFHAHHIPYALFSAEPVGSHPLIKAARQLFRLERDDFPFAVVFDVLQSPYFVERPPALAEDAARLAGITSGWASWKDRLTYWSAHEMSSDIIQNVAGSKRQSAVRATATRLLKSLENLYNDLVMGADEAITWSRHVAWAENLLTRWLGIPPQAEAEEPLVWQGLLDSLRSLAALDALGKPVSRARFLEVWEDKLDRLALPLQGSNHAGVKVLDVMAARGQHFQAVFLLGLNEKSFPRLIREDPFLSEASRSALANALGCRLARKLDGYQEERLLFTLALDMAEDALHLSTQRSDEEGRALVPSLYLQDYLRETGQAMHRLPRAPSEKWGLAARAWGASILTPKETSITLNRQERNPVPFYRALRWDVPLYQMLRQAQNELESFDPSHDARDGRTGPSPLLSAQRDRGFSPNSLQDLAECPFKYYAGKILGLEPIEAPEREGELARDVQGRLMHRILEVYYREGRGSLEKACEVCFQEFSETELDLYPLAWTALKESIRARLESFLKKDAEELAASGFKPAFFEETAEGPMPHLGDPLKDFRFHGRMDRIDLKQESGKTFFRVVDYKTGRSTKKNLKVETGILRGDFLQLPIYLELAACRLKDNLGHSVEPDGATFYNLEDLEKGKEPPCIGPDFWLAYGPPLAQNLKAWIGLVQKGAFYIRPSEENGYCSWCDFASICRKEHPPTSRRSENHPARKTHDERMRRKTSLASSPLAGEE